MCGLHQQINSTRDYALALAWVCACIIIHSLAAQYEEAKEVADFWHWVHDGLVGQLSEGDDCEPLDSFTWGIGKLAIPGESMAQQKCQHIQEALFSELY